VRVCAFRVDWNNLTYCEGKRKGKWTYIAPLLQYTQGVQVWITQFYLQVTPYLHLPRKRSPDGATTDCCCGGHLTAACYSFIDPVRMKG